jgi:hypothetical protein
MLAPAQDEPPAETARKVWGDVPERLKDMMAVVERLAGGTVSPQIAGGGQVDAG